MDGELAATADLATGAVVAAAIEPDHGNTVSGATTDVCLNCGATVSGGYCSACGQKRKVHRTLAEFGHDLLHSVLHFDGKIWRTLPLLAWRPGDLTRRYIHGERAKFVSPLALFLFTVFLTFAMFNALMPAQSDFSITTEVKTDAEFDAVKAEMDKDIAQLQAKLTAAKNAGKPVGDIESELSGLQIARKFVGSTQTAVTGSQEGDGGWRFTDLEFPGSDALNEAVKKGTQNPQLLIYKIQSNAYKYSWALIPISVPFVWLLFFWRRQFKLFDHAVFVTYSLCFMMVTLSIAAILIAGTTYAAIGGLILSFVPPLHMYRQLKYAYGLSRFGAAWRMLALTTFATIALTMFITLIVALGATG